MQRLTPRRVVALQRTAGNRAISSAVQSIVQRVGVKEDPTSETLYNKTSPTGQARAHKYGIRASYDMARNGDSGVTVTVKIKFLSQARNTVDPNAPGSPPGTPPLGKLLDKPTEIPSGDERRAWATTTASEAVKIWAGRLTLVGEERNVFSANTKKRLPVTFNSVAVFGVDDKADNTVIIHPRTTTAGTPGHPIDAGNWYLNKGNYRGDDKVIAAHEYGHLLGIPDEYSQSNEQLNALIHQAAPGTAPSAMAALDKETVRRMVITSLRQPLKDQLAAAMPTITNAIREMRPQVKKRMSSAARFGVTSADVRSELEGQLAAGSEATLGRAIPRVVAFQTTRNFSNRAVAGEGVEAGFSAAALTKQISDAYAVALASAGTGNVAVPGLGDVSINIKSSVPATTQAGGAQAASATGVATTAVGPSASTPGLPVVTPSASLAGQISALPVTWSTAGSALETGVTSGVFAAKMASALKAAAKAAATPPPGTAPAAKIAAQRELYIRAHEMVNSAARAAATQTAAELVAKAVAPVLATSVSALQTQIDTEVTRVMSTPPSGVPALGPADPNMTALVGAMKARLDADKAATKGGGRDPLGAGKAAPDQDVTYSYQGMMGSNNTRALRPDQFEPMVKQFNGRLKKLFEKPFTAEVK